jgi:acyl dehydratase
VKGLALGQTATATRAFTQADVAEYAALSGDANAGWNGVPGPLLGGLFSYLLGTKLPGRGTNYLKQRLAFPGEASVGETITAIVEIVGLRPEKELVNLKATCVSAAGQVVCEGEALVLVRDLERAPEHAES